MLDLDRPDGVAVPHRVEEERLAAERATSGSADGDRAPLAGSDADPEQERRDDGGREGRVGLRAKVEPEGEPAEDERSAHRRRGRRTRSAESTK